ncbi:MAG: GDSL-type esterase/lipase family protein [Pseudomonadota bacterium]
MPPKHPQLPSRRRAMMQVAAGALLLGSWLRPIPALAATNLATVPIGRMDLPWWRKRFEASLQQVRHSRAQLVWLGDSITQNWERNGPQPWADYQPIWQREYERYDALNFGFIGDTTSSVLWRLDHGQVAGLSPKVLILLIGANNLGRPHWGAHLTVPGIEAVVDKVHQLLPDTQVLLLGVLPSRRSAWISEQTLKINAALAARYAHSKRVTFMDVGHVLLDAHGKPDPNLYLEGHEPRQTVLLHPDAQGMERIAQAITPTLDRLMQQAR